MRNVKQYTKNKNYQYNAINGLGGYKEVTIETPNQTYKIDYFEETKVYTMYYTFFNGRELEQSFKTQKEITQEINKNEHLINFKGGL